MEFAHSKKDLPDKHLEVVLRNIGHQLLLYSKDSTSRVLPVTTINEHVYQIAFENSFGFTPDTLMRLVQQQLAKTNMPKNYIVSVNDCHQNKTVFAYEINTNEGNLKPCEGRIQEQGCYIIQIEFLAAKSFGYNYAWLLTACIPLALGGFYLKKRQNRYEQKNQEEKENVPEEESENTDNKTLEEDLEYIQLGQFRLFVVEGILSFNDVKIELFEKEVKALSIFAANKNMVVERDRLKKEIWEDEGVVVIDRNVDVLVSKLRKKLSADASLKIVNVHGKGYKLMIA
jgi:DNA-binding winged helix-turn-helix (wHTH) protein